jgi:hypothetical protein
VENPYVFSQTFKRSQALRVLYVDISKQVHSAVTRTSKPQGNATLGFQFPGALCAMFSAQRQGRGRLSSLGAGRIRPALRKTSNCSLLWLSHNLISKMRTPSLTSNKPKGRVRNSMWETPIHQCCRLVGKIPDKTVQWSTSPLAPLGTAIPLPCV